MYWIPVGKVRIFMEGLQVYFSWQMQNSSSMPKFLCRAKYPSLCCVWNVVILNAHLNQELLEKHTRISHWTISPPCKFSLPSGMYMFTSSCLNFTKTLWGSYPPGHSSPRLAILLMTLGHQLRHSAWINDPRRKCTEYLWERLESSWKVSKCTLVGKCKTLLPCQNFYVEQNTLPCAVCEMLSFWMPTWIRNYSRNTQEYHTGQSPHRVNFLYHPECTCSHPHVLILLKHCEGHIHLDTLHPDLLFSWWL